MIRTTYIFFLLLIFLTSMAQDYSDSTYYEDDYTKDSNSTFHFGLSIGVVAQGLIYKENISNCTCDSLNINGASINSGYNIGIVFDKDITENLWFHSGIQINISKLNINYKNKLKTIDYTFSYSTLQVPLWGQYAFKNKRRGLSWGGGITPSIDISKQSDRELRDFTLNRFELLAGTGPSMRWVLPSGSFLNTSLVFNIGTYNIFKNSSTSIYNETMESGLRYSIILIFSLN